MLSPVTQAPSRESVRPSAVSLSDRGKTRAAADKTPTGIIDTYHVEIDGDIGIKAIVTLEYWVHRSQPNFIDYEITWRVGRVLQLCLVGPKASDIHILIERIDLKQPWLREAIEGAIRDEEALRACAADFEVKEELL